MNPQEDSLHLIPLAGAVVVQSIRCGKAGCPCQQNGKKHGPYYSRIWREGKKVHKADISAADREQVQAQCDLHQEYLDHLRQARLLRKALITRVQWQTRAFLKLQKHQ